MAAVSSTDAAVPLPVTSVLLGTRSFWIGALLVAAFTTLYVVPVVLALLSSREITPEQRQRWGLSVEMTEAQRRLATRLMILLIGSKVLLFGAIAVAAGLIEGLPTIVTVVGSAFVLWLVTFALILRTARKRLPQVENAWTMRER